MHNVEKLPNIVYIFCGIQASRFLKYVSPSFNMIEVTNGLKGTLMQISKSADVFVFM